MKHIILILLASILIVSESCNKPEVIKDVTFKHKNGQIGLVKYYYGKKAKENLFKTEAFYPNGQTQFIKKFKKGIEDGVWLSWYSDGTDWGRTVYINGKKEGESYVNFNNGVHKYVGKYLHNKQVGKWYLFNEDGDTVKVIEYKDGKLVNETNKNKKATKK